MAVCIFCNQEMLNGVSCTLERYDGESEDRIRWDGLNEGFQCHDCGCPPGGLHHPGCDSEICAQCGGQAIACPCTDESGWGGG